MKPMRAKQIVGVWASLLLPINQDDGIDFSQLADQIDRLIASGVHGIYSNGTACEFYTQNETEFDRVTDLLASRCQMSGMPFQIGVSHPSAQTSLERLRRARDVRPAAIQLILPDWLPLNDAETFAFLEHMAAESDPIGLVLYNPPHAKTLLTAAAIARASAQIGGLVGLKVHPAARGSADQWFEAIGPAKTRLSIFTPGHLLHQHVPFGSAGSYSNVACISPAGAKRWFDQMHHDLVGAEDVGRRLLQFFDAYITPLIKKQGYCNAAVDKLLAAVGGWRDAGTRVRWPYRSIAESYADQLAPLLRRAVPELFV